MRTLARCAAALAVAASSAPAYARDTNPEGVPVGHRALGMGGAYTAVAGDGVSLWYNPAGLGGLARKGISANVTVYQWRSQTVDPFVHFGSDEEHPAIEIEGDGKAESSDFSTVPSSLVLSMPLGEKGGHGIAGGLFVPDADNYVVKASRSLIVPGRASAALKARDVLDERSYWVGAGYGYDAGKWAFGFSGFAVAHLLQRAVIVSLITQGLEQDVSLVETREFETTDVSGVVQIGGLYRVSDTLTLGLNVRSPTLGRLYTQGSTLIVRGNEATGQNGQRGFIDRLETDALDAEQRLPLRVNAGLAWRPSPRLLLTADLHGVAPVGRYDVFEADLLCPPGPGGEEVRCNPNDERTVDLTVARERAATVNVAVGAEIGLSEKFLLRLGAYTDFSTVDDFNEDEPLEARVNIFSGVVGLGYLGERGSTDVGLLFRRGNGETESPFNFSASDTDASTTVIGLYLAGSADI